MLNIVGSVPIHTVSVKCWINFKTKGHNCNFVSFNCVVRFIPSLSQFWVVFLLFVCFYSAGAFSFSCWVGFCFCRFYSDSSFI